MYKLRRVVAGLAVIGGMPAASLTATEALAQEAPNWSGIYFGVSAGALTTNTSFVFDNVTHIEPFSIRKSSLSGGGHIGFDHQFGLWTLGLEGAVVTGETRKEQESREALLPRRFRIAEIESLLTLSAKIGYSLGHVRPYITAGYAGAGVRIDSINRNNGFTSATRSFESGYSVGGGFDFHLSRNTIFGLDYKYIALDVDDRSGGFVGPTGVLGGPFSVSDGDVNVQTLMARLTYKFDREAAPAPEPMK